MGKMRFDPSEYMGKTFNRLTVIGLSPISENQKRNKLICKCECGGTAIVFPYQLKNGAVKSCGCSKFGHKIPHGGNSSHRKTHGLSSHPLYKKWNNMIRRCYNPKEPNYHRYGGIGITVCDEWKESPAKFIEWAEKACKGDYSLTIDRIDGSKGYSPDNCRFVTVREQQFNLKSNRNIEINGEVHCFSEWCRIYGIAYSTAHKRIERGMEPYLVFTTPVTK